jgi:hypothetical protein
MFFLSLFLGEGTQVEMYLVLFISPPLMLAAFPGGAVCGTFVVLTICQLLSSSATRRVFGTVGLDGHGRLFEDLRESL